MNMKLKRQKNEYLKKLKRLEGFKVRELKDLEKVNSFSGCTLCWSSSRTKVENVPIRMNGKMPPKVLRFLKKCNGHR